MAAEIVRKKQLKASKKKEREDNLWHWILKNRQETQVPAVAAAQPQQEIEVVQEYDIVADREQMSTALTNSPEVDALASQIDVYSLETIVSFGAEAAEEISKCSDVVLNSMSMSQLDDSSEMLNTLA